MHTTLNYFSLILSQCFSKANIKKIVKSNYYIKEGYITNIPTQCFNDVLDENHGVVYQPDVYSFAAFLGRRFKSNYIIDIGCGRAMNLVDLCPEFKIIGIDYGPNIQYCRKQYPFGQWIECDLGKDVISLKKSLIKNSVIICSDVIEHLENPLNLLKNIKVYLSYASAAIITTPDRDLVQGVEDFGPPENKNHVREWNLSEMETLLKSIDIRINYCGYTTNNNHDLEKKTAMFVLGNNNEPNIRSAPKDFRVVAFMTAYNEEDIIVPSISYLINQGIEVYLIDNWSTDATYERAHQLLGKGLIGIERFPVDGPSSHYEWGRLLSRVEELAIKTRGNWFIHHDADEIREAPWPDVKLKDAIYYVDCLNYNAIDHTVIAFNPVDNHYVPGNEFKNYYSYFEFGKRPGHFVQIKAWKNLFQKISLKTSGGHDVKFDGRRVFPYKFLLRHYPIRSQKQGEEKILRRKLYSNPKEKEKGWHTMYDSVKQDQIIWKPDDLLHFHESSFYRQYLVERLSGIGIIGSSGK